ncbi:hypothetical protein AX16_009715, partial [Volvariella volvacea WC 439]
MPPEGSAAPAAAASESTAESSAVPTAVESPSQMQANFFTNATVINAGGTIRNEAHFHRPPTSAELEPLLRSQKARDMLVALIVFDAMHTGNVSREALGCHPETRRRVIQDIIMWIEHAHQNMLGNVLWLHGPAGIGKSAVMKTIADKLDAPDSPAKVAGSFFFWRGDPLRNSLSRFIPTLAYQLAMCVESIGREIYRAIDRDPAILNASVDAQWRKLIADPIEAASNVPPAVIILDGLEECKEQRDQKKVLELIGSYRPN